MNKISATGKLLGFDVSANTLKFANLWLHALSDNIQKHLQQIMQIMSALSLAWYRLRFPLSMAQCMHTTLRTKRRSTVGHFLLKMLQQRRLLKYFYYFLVLCTDITSKILLVLYAQMLVRITLLRSLKLFLKPRE